jgi:3-hydroxyisobutyrate dehydrogenase-like beta-hydroxyacid dehydrogenase
MRNKTITLLNPGDMGASIGASARAAGHRVYWVSAGRSAASASRAEAAGLDASASLSEALSDSDVVLSVCPPHAALDTARAVADANFQGLYIDGNAVSPATAAKVGTIVRGAGARFGDGGIIGPPVSKLGSTRMFFSGAHAAEAASLFEGSLLGTVVLNGPDEAASSIKMCYAAWTKGTTALLADIRALAQASQVEDALLEEWDLSQPGVAQSSETRVRTSAFKAWRWVAEMNEIADSFENLNLPDGFHRAAAQVYERLAPFKEDRDPEMSAVLGALLNGKD